MSHPCDEDLEMVKLGLFTRKELMDTRRCVSLRCISLLSSGDCPMYPDGENNEL